MGRSIDNYEDLKAIAGSLNRGILRCHSMNDDTFTITLVPYEESFEDCQEFLQELVNRTGCCSFEEMHELVGSFALDFYDFNDAQTFYDFLLTND